MEKLRQQDRLPVREIMEKERKIWNELGFPIMVIKNIPPMITCEVMKKAGEYNLVLNYIPQLELPSRAFLKEVGIDDFLSKLNEKHPKWKVLLTNEDKSAKNHGNLEKGYWELMKNDRIEFPKLGHWMLVEKVKILGNTKKRDSKKHSKSNLLDKIIPEAYSQRLPVFCPADKLFKNLAQKKSEILSVFRFSKNDMDNIEVRLPGALELNLLSNRHLNWQDRNVFELTNDSYKYCGINYHLAVGGLNERSDICVIRDDEQFYRNPTAGFRIAIVFNP